MPSTGPSPVEIKRYGENLARAIDDIRESGTIVRPTGRGDFCVGDGASAVYATKAELHGMAVKVREKRRATKPAKSKNAAGLRNPPPGEGVVEAGKPDPGRRGALAEPSCGIAEGREEATHNSHHVGHSSGAVAAPAGVESGPQETVKPTLRPTQLRCEKCGGPRSKWSAAFCRACYVPAGRKPDIAAQAEAAGIRFAALSIEQQEAQLAAQKASFVRAEMGMGSDVDEAEYRRRLRAGATADAPDKFARLANMAAARPPARIRSSNLVMRIKRLEERDAAKDRAIAELRERLDQFTGEGR